MQRTSFEAHPCSIAQALDVAGEWWTPLVLRDVAYGIGRFSELQEDLGISANVLAARLEALVGSGVLTTVPYQERPERHEYVLTEKGRQLVPVLLALMRWGDRWGWPDGPRSPVRVLHETCGEEVEVELGCRRCGRPVAPDELLATPGDRPERIPGPGEPGHRSARRLGSEPGGVRLARHTPG